MIHRIQLTNGQVLLVEESKVGNTLTIALGDESAGASDEHVEAYVCMITPDGVLVYTNSADACEVLTRPSTSKKSQKELRIQAIGNSGWTDGYYCKEIFDINSNMPMVEVKNSHREPIGSIPDCSLPDESDEESMENFKNTLETWLVDNEE